MLAVSRREEIREYLVEKRSATVSELSKLLGVTEETVRRDLSQLEKSQVLVRTHGGAYLREGIQRDIALNIREHMNTESKRLIAKTCDSLISDGDTIFLDFSTTAVFLAESIRFKRITVLTNSRKITDILCGQKNITLILTGGTYDPASDSFLGSQTISCIKQHFVDKCFVSCRAIHKDQGLFDVFERTADIRRAAIAQSESSYLIADKSKFNKTAFIKLAELNQITKIVTDFSFDTSWRQSLEKNKTSIYFAG